MQNMNGKDWDSAEITQTAVDEMKANLIETMLCDVDTLYSAFGVDAWGNTCLDADRFVLELGKLYSEKDYDGIGRLAAEAAREFLDEVAEMQVREEFS